MKCEGGQPEARLGTAGRRQSAGQNAAIRQLVAWVRTYSARRALGRPLSYISALSAMTPDGPLHTEPSMRLEMRIRLSNSFAEGRAAEDLV
jgi:hypothetical protein